ncbi:uncharacterized protein PHALS_06706 [Plasmopara halstedii]|uniref:Uncharacterized protein n=1 Tax=Plasmopara halstedii TaxID=4781 RepID=A0A0P1B2G4_PLAHL|nr:uncharacterized protein PHALS_06706 [Plasmopara halstedii]CEG48913.1 hypothetical protein PHALS_06706 [Plasmopara halstedii]|eukprot:XP_024585282.1 hypothetical protein PHALS_06706 [Plasmopara halstedii]
MLTRHTSHDSKGLSIFLDDYRSGKIIDSSAKPVTCAFGFGRRFPVDCDSSFLPQNGLGLLAQQYTFPDQGTSTRLVAKIV